MLELIKITLNVVEVISFWIAFFGFAWLLGKRGPVKFIDKKKFECEKSNRYETMQSKHFSSLLKSLLFKIDLFLITLLYRRDLVLYWACISLFAGFIAKYVRDKL